MNLDLMDFGATSKELRGPPREDAPDRAAPYETRAAWSEQYVTWLIDQIDEQASWASDIHATHRYEVEFNSCVLDPQTYERQTREELAPKQVH